MKKISDRIRKRRLINIAQNISIFAISILLTTAVFAIRVEINAAIPAGFTGPIQLIRAVGGVDSPGPGPNEMGGPGANDVLTRMVSIVDAALGDDNVPLVIQDNRILASGGVEQVPTGKADIAQGTVLNLRIWDGAAGLGHKYIQSSQAITWAARDAAVPWIIGENNWTRKTAAIPSGVGVKVDKEAIERTGADQLLRLSISAFGSGIEDVTGTQMQISKDKNFADVGAQNGGLTIPAGSSVCEGAYFGPEKTYFIRAQMTNNYGTSALAVDIGKIANPGDAVTGKVGQYTTLAGGVGQIVDRDIYNLKINLTKRPSGFGINTVVFPFLQKDASGKDQVWTCIDLAPPQYTNQPIDTIGKLVDLLNKKAGRNIVQTIGYWDRDKQEAKGMTFDNSVDPPVVSSHKGTIDLADKIESFVGYQIYVSESVGDINLKGVAK